MPQRAHARSLAGDGAAVVEFVKELLRTAAQRYDLLVIDTCPLIPRADTRAMLDHVDVVVMVVEAHRTSTDEVRMGMRLVPVLAGKPLRVVLNKEGQGGRGASLFGGIGQPAKQGFEGG